MSKDISTILEKIEEVQKQAEQSFHVVYGKYESTSGKMWLEVYHNENFADNENFEKGSVVWRRGIGDEVTEDKILTREQAIPLFVSLIKKGFTQVFKGKIKSDIDAGNQKLQTSYSIGRKKGWLGKYVKHKKFIKISQYRDEDYYLETGYDGIVTSSEIANGFRTELFLELKLDEGYVREGEEREEEIKNPLAMFGIIDEEEEEHTPVTKNQEVLDILSNIFD